MDYRRKMLHRIHTYIILMVQMVLLLPLLVKVISRPFLEIQSPWVRSMNNKFTHKHTHIIFLI
jgi:hypothetical protein